jgi:uncharacterized protein YchJ
MFFSFQETLYRSATIPALYPWLREICHCQRQLSTEECCRNIFVQELFYFSEKYDINLKALIMFVKDFELIQKDKTGSLCHRASQARNISASFTNYQSLSLLKTMSDYISNQLLNFSQ